MSVIVRERVPKQSLDRLGTGCAIPDTVLDCSRLPKNLFGEQIVSLAMTKRGVPNILDTISLRNGRG